MAEIEMTIDSIRVASRNSNRNLILKEKSAERYLPIWIGNAEADAIGIKLQGIQCSRPLTHDFLCAVIEALGATVKSAIINKLEDGMECTPMIGQIGLGESGGVTPSSGQC